MSPTTTTRVSSKGQIVLPAALRERDGIRPGQTFRIERLEEGEYRLVRAEEAPNTGLVDWLRACPDSTWFTPVPSEETDTLKSFLDHHHEE